MWQFWWMWQNLMVDVAESFGGMMDVAVLVDVAESFGGMMDVAVLVDVAESFGGMADCCGECG